MKETVVEEFFSWLLDFVGFAFVSWLAGWLAGWLGYMSMSME